MQEEVAAPAETASSPRPERWRLVAGAVSLALGMLSCLSCLFGILPGIPAVVLGFIVSAKSSRTGERMPGTGMACTGILLGSLGIAISLALLPHAMANKADIAQQPMCQNNLKSIGMCLKMYANSNEGAFPDKLSRLYPEYVRDDEIHVFVCPSTGMKPGDPARIDEWTDYTYRRASHKSETAADMGGPVCFDSEFRHTPMRRNELYVDGRVAFIQLGHPSR